MCEGSARQKNNTPNTLLPYFLSQFPTTKNSKYHAVISKYDSSASASVPKNVFQLRLFLFLLFFLAIGDCILSHPLIKVRGERLKVEYVCT